jgi:hypothetical protein
MAFELIVGAALLGLLAFQGWLTARVWKSHLYERKQKVWQVQLIWLLPVIGAGLVFHVLQDDERSERGPSTQRKS